MLIKVASSKFEEDIKKADSELTFSSRQAVHHSYYEKAKARQCGSVGIDPEPFSLLRAVANSNFDQRRH